MAEKPSKSHGASLKRPGFLLFFVVAFSSLPPSCSGSLCGDQLHRGSTHGSRPSLRLATVLSEVPIASPGSSKEMGMGQFEKSPRRLRQVFGQSHPFLGVAKFYPYLWGILKIDHGVKW